MTIRSRQVDQIGNQIARKNPAEINARDRIKQTATIVAAAGEATCQTHQIFLSIVGSTSSPSRMKSASVVHKHREEKNDRERNSDQPKQSTFSERHRILH
jgi:hypothetical protein